MCQCLKKAQEEFTCPVAWKCHGCVLVHSSPAAPPSAIVTFIVYLSRLCGVDQSVPLSQHQLKRRARLSVTVVSQPFAVPAALQRPRDIQSGIYTYLIPFEAAPACCWRRSLIIPVDLFCAVLAPAFCSRHLFAAACQQSIALSEAFEPAVVGDVTFCECWSALHAAALTYWY